MSEEIKAMAVKIALEDSSFQEGVKSLKTNLNVINSEFSSSVAGVKDWGKSIDGLKANAQALGEKISVQKQIIESYSNQLQKSKDTLLANSEKMLELKSRLEGTKAAYEQSKAAVGENDEATQKLKTELDALNKQYISAESLVKKNDTTVQGYTIQLNNAKGALNGMESEMTQTNSDIKNFDENIKKADKSTTGFSDTMKNKLNSGLKAVTIGAAAALAVLVKLASIALESADKTQTMADIYGMTAERIQELTYAGTKLDVEIETIVKAQTKLTKSMYEAKEGTGEQSQAFKALGIDVTNADGSLRDSAVVMAEVIDRLGAMANETDRDALSLVLMGKSALELNPIIKAGGTALADLSKEAHNVGAVLSNESIESLDKLADSMDAAKIKIQASLAMAFVPLIPKLQEIVDEVSKFDPAPLINGFKWFIDNPEIIITLGALVVATKGFLVVTEVAKGVKALTVALAASKAATIAQTAATGTATAAQWSLNAAMDANPVGVLIIGLAALIAVIVALNYAADANTRKIEENKQAAIKAINERYAAEKEALEKTQAERLKAISAETTAEQVLYDKNSQAIHDKVVKAEQKRIKAMQDSLAERESILEESHNAEIERIQNEYGVFEEKEKSKTELAQEQYNLKVSLIDEITSLSEDAADQEGETFQKTYDAILSKATEVHNEKILMYEQEYLIALGLINSDLSATIKGYKDQITAIQNKTTEEDRILKEQADAQKIIDLQKKVDDAKTDEDKLKAVEALNSEITRQNREKLLAEREEQIADLNIKITTAVEKAKEEKDKLLIELQAKIAGEQIEIKKNTDFNIAEIQRERTEKEIVETAKYEAAKKSLADEKIELDRWIEEDYEISLQMKLDKEMEKETTRHTTIMDNLKLEAEAMQAAQDKIENNQKIEVLREEIKALQAKLNEPFKVTGVGDQYFYEEGKRARDAELQKQIDKLTKELIALGGTSESARSGEADLFKTKPPPGYASGGIVANNNPIKYGEKGGEIIRLPSNSFVIPNDISMQIARGIGASAGGSQSPSAPKTTTVNNYYTYQSPKALDENALATIARREGQRLQLALSAAGR